MSFQEIKNSYINYNWFPILADHCLDASADYYKSIGVSRLSDKETFNPEDVQDGDIIYVKTDFIFHGVFQRDFMPKIKSKFTLVTGASSYQVSKGCSISSIIDSDFLIKWYCTNAPTYMHDKILPLPIGFDEFEREAGNQELLKEKRKNRTPFKDKKNKIYLPYHNFETNQHRKLLFDFIKNIENVFAETEKLDFCDYMDKMDKHKYIICLEGSGPDLHRNYECLLLDCVPINQKNVIENLFNFHKIPSIFIDGWDCLTPDYVEQLMSRTYDFGNTESFLSIKYHEKIIKS